MSGDLLATFLLFSILGLSLIALGLYCYRGRNAGRLKSQLLFRVFPGAACGMPLGGAACLGVALALTLPQPIRSLVAWPSIAMGLTAVAFFGWYPRRLLPGWLRDA
jgi:hypothetical protein